MLVDPVTVWPTEHNRSDLLLFSDPRFKRAGKFYFLLLISHPAVKESKQLQGEAVQRTSQLIIISFPSWEWSQVGGRSVSPRPAPQQMPVDQRGAMPTRGTQTAKQWRNKPESEKRKIVLVIWGKETTWKNCLRKWESQFLWNIF